MRNLKRALSLALASIMVLGLMVVGASAASFNDFTDKDEIKNTEAVNTMVSLGVISGKDNGAYDPTGSLTRAEACTLIARMLGGGKDPILGSNIKSNFKDTQGHWAETYIAYCANLGIIAGVGDGNFKPNDTLTGSAAAKMVLCALGYKPEFEGIGGANWELATNTLATKVKLYNGLETLNPSATISRDDVAQLIYNGVQAQEVEYRNLQGDYSGTLYATDNGTMLANRFGVTKVEGVVVANEVFAIDGGAKTLAGKVRLADTNKYYVSGSNEPRDYDAVYPISMSNDLVGQRVVIYVKFQNALAPNAATSTVVGTPIVSDKTTVASTTSKLKDADAVKSFLSEAGLTIGTAAALNGTVTVKGDSFTADEKTAPSIKAILDVAKDKPGTEVTAIDHNGDGSVDYLFLETAGMAKVTVYNTKDSKLSLNGVGSIDFKNVANADEVAKDDIVLYTKYNETYYLQKVETVNGEYTAWNSSNSKATIGGTAYSASAVGTSITGLTAGLPDNTLIGNSYTLYLDASGNVVAYELYEEAASNYALVLAAAATAADPGVSLSNKGEVKLLLADGTTATYTVDLVASASKYGKTGTTSEKETAMVNVLKGSIANTIVTYTVNSNGTVTIGNPAELSKYGVDSKDSLKYVSTSSLYEYDSEKVVVNDSTIFFFNDGNGKTSVITGLKNLPTKGVEGATNVVYFEGTGNNIAKAIYVGDEFTGNSNYVYISGKYVQSENANGEAVYTYPVVFEDGTTGELKTTVGTYGNGFNGKIVTYTTNSDGYSEFETDTFTNMQGTGRVVNDVVVTYADGAAVAVAAGADQSKANAFTLANGVVIKNVEDTDAIFDESALGEGMDIDLILDKDGYVKTVFVSGTNVEFGTVTNTAGATITGNVKSVAVGYSVEITGLKVSTEKAVTYTYVVGKDTITGYATSDKDGKATITMPGNTNNGIEITEKVDA